MDRVERTPMPDAYSEHTHALIAQLLRDNRGCFAGDTASRVLDLLAERGLLLPEGGETRTLHNVAFRSSSGRFIVDDDLAAREPEGHEEWETTKDLFGADCYRVTREVTTFPDGSYLARPWSPIPPEPKESV